MVPIRALVTGAGTGSSANVIRALRTLTPRPRVVGVNHDRFTLSRSPADANYLSAPYNTREFATRAAEVVRRERINVVLPTDDDAVKAFSDHRGRFPASLFLPRRATIDLCQDKYALTAFLRARRIPAPRTYPVTSLERLDRIFARFPPDAVLWCRARRGSRSLAGTAVASVDQARGWIDQWRALRGVDVSAFTLAEYLPGRHLIVQSLWRDGALVLVHTTEVLSYFTAGNNPSGVFSLSSLAKTVVAPAAAAVSLDAVRALEARPSGTFIVELREAADGTPCITEINAGRFPSGVTALLARGRHNMVGVFAACALGERVVIDDPENFAGELYLVRDIDALPGVVSPRDLLQAGVGKRAKVTYKSSRRRGAGRAT